MEYNIEYRKELYKEFSSKNVWKNLKKTKYISSGTVGDVYKYCIINNDKKCLVVKNSYLTNKESKYIDDTFSKKGLNISIFIEYASMQLTNELVLQNICPHYVLNYNRRIKERYSICSDEYPYKNIIYNELIENDNEYNTFESWVQEYHTNITWYVAYFQIIVSIYAMLKYFNMSHFDLHSRNVLVKNVKKGGFYKYIIDNKEYYLPNIGYIFFINDYDQVWVPNKFKSQFSKTKYNLKNIYDGYDLMILFKSTLSFATTPDDVKKDIREIIIKLRQKKKFPDIIYKLFNNMFNIENLWKYKIKNKKPIDIFDFTKELNIKKIRKELMPL